VEAAFHLANCGTAPLPLALIVIAQAGRIGILAPEAWKIEGTRSPPQLWHPITTIATATSLEQAIDLLDAVNKIPSPLTPMFNFFI
jgi:hypothetical protein